VLRIGILRSLQRVEQNLTMRTRAFCLCNQGISNSGIGVSPVGRKRLPLGRSESMVVSGVVGNGLGRAHDEPPMLHPFCADKPVRKLLHILRGPTKYDHFETTLVVEVCMQGGNDYFMILVLEIGELLRQKAGMMVVNKRDRAHDKRVCGDHHRADEPVANQIAKGFRAVLVALVRDEGIKAA
jgi:hypothetical protein